MGRGKTKPQPSVTVYKVKEKTPNGFNRYFYQSFLEANNLITTFSTVPESRLREEYSVVIERIKAIDNVLYVSPSIELKEKDKIDLAEERYLLTQYKCDLQDAVIKKKRQSVSSCNKKLLDGWYLTGDLFSVRGKTGRFPIIKGRCI